VGSVRQGDHDHPAWYWAIGVFMLVAAVIVLAAGLAAVTFRVLEGIGVSLSASLLEWSSRSGGGTILFGFVFGIGIGWVGPWFLKSARDDNCHIGAGGGTF
jgi:hypothetical protein